MNAYGNYGAGIPPFGYQQQVQQPRFQTQRPQYRISVNSRVVFSQEEFHAIPADLDGSLLLCPDLNNKTIWAKQLDLETGKVDTMQFQMVPPPPAPEYVDAGTFRATIDELKEMIRGLQQPKAVTKKKGVTQDVVSESDGE